MTQRLSIEWPDPRPFAGRDGPIRLLAVSDEHDPALEQPVNREALGPLDLIVGCGDLDAEELCFLGDAFAVPLVYVLGNHDRGARWTKERARLPSPIGTMTEAAGLGIVGLSWPGSARPEVHARRDEGAAWTDVGKVAGRVLLRRALGRGGPVVVASHAAPRGAGDGPDRYHRGFGAYRWLLGRLRPPLWLHGHTHPASRDAREVHIGGTTVYNVTGSVLIELRRPVGLRAP